MNVWKNIDTDILFDIYFKGLFEKPHEHKEECILILYSHTLDTLDSIIEHLKGWKK